MQTRLGKVLFWTGIIIAAGWAWFITSITGSDPPSQAGQDAVFAFVPAAIAIGIGWALKYILATEGAIQ